MNWTMTTVSYRYHLYSFLELVHIARRCGFSSIELWEPHLKRNKKEISSYVEDGFSVKGKNQGLDLYICALSAYQDLTDFTDGQWMQELEEKLKNCRQLSIPTLCLSTGSLAGLQAGEQDWTKWYHRLENVQKMADWYQVQVVFGTQPGTMLDHIEGVERFIQAIEKNNWTHILLNVDVFHVWEFGIDPLVCLEKWHPYIGHIRLKNAKHRTDQLSLANVYHPMGKYDHLTSLKDGVVDIGSIVSYLQEQVYSKAVTIEWLGYPDAGFFQQEIDDLNRMKTSKKEFSI